MMQVVVLYFIVNIKLFSAYDPCLDYKELPDMDRRFTSYESDTANGEEEICDGYLPLDFYWYKAEVDMPTTPPNHFECGTRFPIWFNGTIPKKENEMSAGTGCLFVSNSMTCDTQYTVSIKNCGEYSVYQLGPTHGCPQAYCFGIGIADDPPKEVLKTPTILTSLVPKEFDGSVRDVLLFKCDFGTEDELTSAFYQVTWNSNGVSFRTKVAVKHDLYALYLQDHHLRSLGRTLSCVVRPKNLKNGRPGTLVRSADFFAGIKVNSTTLSMIKDGNTTINLDLTVPFGCLWKKGIKTSCDLFVEMRVPKATNGQCSGTIAPHAVRCRQKINSNHWNKTASILVQYKGIGTYTLGYPNTFIMKLSISSAHTLWNGYALPPIQVNIYEDPSVGKWAGKICKSYNDPHMQTFDKQSYEHQKAGVYTLYEHMDQNRKMEVQIELKSCNPPWQSNFCNCGVAVRAGGDVFIVDMCNSSHSIMGYRTCNDKILDVRKFSKNEKLYSIFFPTGTKVVLTTSVGYMNVDIKASVHDYKKTRGLCGYMSDDGDDDFLSNTENGMHHSDFSNSWKINDEERNLFRLTTDKKLEMWNANDIFCDCPENVMDENYFHCSPGTAVTCLRDASFDKIGMKTCYEISHGRKRRSIEFPWKAVSRRRRRRSVPISNNNVNMTANEALKYCNDIMGTSKIFKACNDIPNMLGNDALNICALDIQLTNSVDWTKSTMETFKSNCIGELQDNSTLNQASDDRPSIAQTIQDILCPGFPECTNNGKCINGTCECDEGFVASDCSTDKSVPPDVYGVLGDGLCDLSEIECDTAFVVGEDIGSSAELSCRITEYEISELGKKSSVSTWIANATLETIMEVHCPLYTSTRQKRDVNMGTVPFMKGYSMGVSYDKKNFGEELEMIVYNSKCQVADMSVNPPIVGLKKSTCFINGKCYLSNEGNTVDVCRVCDPTMPYQWSTSEVVQGCIRLKNESLAWITGPILGSVAALVIIATLLTLYYKRSRAKVKAFASLK